MVMMTLLHRRCRRRCRSSEQTIERRCRRRVEEHVAVRIRRRVVVVVVRPKHAQIREQRGQVRERKRVRVEHVVRVVVAGGDAVMEVVYLLSPLLAALPLCS